MRIITFILVLFVSISAFSITNNNSEYANNADQKMRRIAIDFMKKQGVEPDGKSFRLHKRNNEYQVFADNSKGQFVVVADEKYHDYVKNPVLAFSFNSQYKPNEFTYSLFDFYVKELKALQERGVSSEGFFNKDNSSSEILLEGIEYGQGAPFNYYCPETGSGRSARKSLVGCVPVALAQTMSYYNFPETGEGRNKYSWGGNNGTDLELDFAKVNFDWSNIRKSYRSGNNDKTSVESVGTLMKAVGVALSANYGSANTSASLQNMKKALINNFSYKSSCFYLFNEMPDKRDFYSLIYKEIDNKRPVITASQGHAFVCDGYKDEFLHFNLGWDGVMNGYYRTNLNDDNGAEYLLTELIAGIEPERDSQVKEKMVELSEPGTLANHLSDEEVISLNKLTVKGKINSSDIALIRRMSGAVDNNNLFRKIGVLESLDLSEAKIVKSDAPYYVTDASQAGFRVEMKKAGKNVVYDFSNITVSDWEEIYAKKAHVGKDYIIEKENDKYLMKLFASENEIGNFMFKNCESLKEIVLPKTLKRIGNSSFQSCTSLKTLELPKSTRSIGQYAFANTFNLETIEVDSKFDNYRENSFFNSNPYFKGFNVKTKN